MPKGTSLLVFFGMIASGKSTLAQAWADKTGAVHYNSDVVRKELAGLTASARQEDSFNAGIYSAEFSRKTYDALLAKAEANLSQGKAVILDASYQAQSERKLVLELAANHQAKLKFILCTCPDDTVKERLAIRAQDKNAVSDGRWEIYVQQKERFKSPDELGTDQLLILDTNDPITVLVKKLKTML